MAGSVQSAEQMKTKHQENCNLQRFNRYMLAMDYRAIIIQTDLQGKLVGASLLKFEAVLFQQILCACQNNPVLESFPRAAIKERL